MCRTIGCFMKMSGHGHEIGNIGDLMGLLSSLGAMDGAKKEPPTHEQFIQESIKDIELTNKMNHIALEILKAKPPEDGAKLMSLEVAKPIEPEKHGIATIATYELTSGAYLVIGVDHQSQGKISHMTPNIHGLAGLTKAVMHELNKQAADQEEGETQKADAEGTATS